MSEVKIPFNIPGAKPPKANAEETPKVTTQEEVVKEPEVLTAESREAQAQAKPKKKVNRKATRVITPGDIQFVINNIKKMSYAELAEARGLTKYQINRILMDIKKQLREEAKKTGKTEQVEKFIKEHLSRPEDSKPGGNKGGGAMKNAINSTVNEILSKL